MVHFTVHHFFLLRVLPYFVRQTRCLLQQTTDFPIVDNGKVSQSHRLVSAYHFLSEAIGGFKEENSLQERKVELHF